MVIVNAPEATRTLRRTLHADVRKMRALVDDPDLVTAKRQKLVEVATRLFRTKGFHDTATRDIALAADMSVGAIYQYIRHKEDLLLLILQFVVDIYQERVYRVADEQGTARERLMRTIDIYYRTLDEHHVKTQVLYHEFSGLKATKREHVNQVEREVGDVFERILTEGIANGEFAPCDTLYLTHMIVSMGHMWALKRWRFRDVLTLDDYINQTQDAVARLLAR